MLSADKVHSFRRKYVLSSQTNTVHFWWEIQTNESKSPEQVVLPSWKEVLLLCLPVEGQFSGIGCVNCWSQWSWQWLTDDLSRSIGNYKMTPTASGKSCRRWQCFTRSTTPMSPRTWRGSLPSWRAEPRGHPIIVSLEGRGRLCRQLLLMPGCRLCPLEATSATWLEVRGWALRAAGGDEQVVVQLSSSFLWRRMQWWDVNEQDREDEGFSAEMQKGKLMFAQAAVFNPQWEVFLFAPPCPRSCLHSRDQVQVSVKFSCNDGGDQSRWCLQWWCQRW